MAKTNRSLTSITPAAPGEQAFIDLFRANIKDALKKLRVKDGGINDGAKKVKVFNRAKFHFGNDEAKSIEDYDCNQNQNEAWTAKSVIKSIKNNQVQKDKEDKDRQNSYQPLTSPKKLAKRALKYNSNDDYTDDQNESDVTLQRLRNAHKKKNLRHVYVNGIRVGSVLGGTNKNAKKIAHLSGKGGEVEVVKEELTKAQKKAVEKYAAIEKFHLDRMKSKMDTQSRGEDDRFDPDRTGELSFHKSLRAFHNRQFIEDPQRDDAAMRTHERSIKKWDRREQDKYEAHKKKRPNLAGGTGHSASGHVGHFGENTELSEVSTDLLRRYARKSLNSLGTAAFDAGTHNKNTGKDAAMREFALEKAAKRKKGVYKALDKMAVNQAANKSVNEISAGLKQSYTRKAAAELGGQGDKYVTKPLAVDAKDTKKLHQRDVGIRHANKKVNEVLGPDAKVSDYIHDFVHSDNPKFEGKSKKERIKMALGAYYGRNEGEVISLDDKRRNKLHPATIGALNFDNSVRDEFRKKATKLGRIKPGDFPKPVQEKAEAELPWLKKLADKNSSERDPKKEAIRAKAQAKASTEDKKKNMQEVVDLITRIVVDEAHASGGKKKKYLDIKHLGKDGKPLPNPVADMHKNGWKEKRGAYAKHPAHPQDYIDYVENELKNYKEKKKEEIK